MRVHLTTLSRASLLAGLGVALAAMALAIMPVDAASHAASVVDFAFEPAAITVQTGDTVVWTNSGHASHTVTQDTGGFDSGILAPGATFSLTFTRAGTFAYHCNVHPTMHGTITVTAAAPATGAAPAGAMPSAKPAAPSQSSVGGSAARSLPATGTGGPSHSALPRVAVAIALLLAVIGIGLRGLSQPS